MSNYPRDEFDDVPETPRRQGVHRAKAAVETARRGIAVVLVTAAIVVLVIAAALFIVPKYLSSTAAPSSPAQSTSSAAASQSASASPSATPTPSATSTPTPTPTADHSLQIGVYNATTTGGLGNRVATAARNAGWAVAAVGNWAGTPVSSSVVFYRDPNQKASAQALATDLGIANVQQAQQLGFPLAAVVGPGYAG